MHEAKHAIKVTPNEQGWAWELIDTDGATTTAGVAAHQQGAMEAAWRASRSSSDLRSDGYPEIVLGHLDNDLQRPRRVANISNDISGGVAP